MPRSCWRVSSSPATSASKGRSANGPATTPATCGPSRCSTSRPSTTATIRSCSAARRSARPTRSAAIARWCAPALLRENIEKAGVPGVAAAWAHEVGNARLLLAVAINQRYPGHARQAGHIATMCHVGAYCGRYTIVVDDDIDVSNLEEVIWALLTRSDPGDLDRHHPQRLVDAARSAHRARAQGGRRLHQQPRHHRRLPAVPLARQVPGREPADARSGGARRCRSSATCSRPDRRNPRRDGRSAVAAMGRGGYG